MQIAPNCSSTQEGFWDQGSCMQPWKRLFPFPSLHPKHPSHLKHPLTAWCLCIYPSPQERHGSQWECHGEGIQSFLDLLIPPHLGSTTPTRVKRSLSTDPGLTHESVNSENDDSRAVPEEHLPMHPVQARGAVPKQSNRQRPQYWQSPFQPLD